MRSPLLVACEVKALESERHLMLSTDALMTVADENGMETLHWMCMHGASELHMIAMQKGADVHAVNSSFQTPLHLTINGADNSHALWCCSTRAPSPMP